VHPVIRPALAGDAPALQDIERLAGAGFRDVGMADIADADPLPRDVLAAYADAGRAWVATTDADEPIGYVVIDVVDGNAHVEQISVSPEHQGEGVGRALLDVVRAWARDRGMPALTLSTFIDVPWNAPLYRRLGFHDLADAEIGPELQALVAAEAAHGLDPTTRTCMRAEV
jgi:GNAT superfamily N-acetyltransferase